MGELNFLRDLVVIFGAAILVVAVLHRIGIPGIAGFILAGTLVGPTGLGFVHDVHQVEVLAEIGVVLLMFGIGFELSIERVKRLWKPIVIGGALQVGITIVIVALIVVVFGFPWRSAVFIGCLIAVSSTAIVLRGLEKRGELDAPHGRLALGILLFQDLCVIPMMLMIPLLSDPDASIYTLGVALTRAGVILVVVLVLARLIVPNLLNLVARTRQNDLFILAIMFICIATAWTASTAGISLSLGAFLAGLVVAGSEYRYRALSETVQFRELFMSVFFVSVGMLFKPNVFWSSILEILGILLAILVGKFLIIFAVSMIMKLPSRVGLLSAIGLANVGEFFFVLDRAAAGTELLTGPFADKLLAASILSMVLTPFALTFGPSIVAGVDRIPVLTRLFNVKTATEAEEEVNELSDHVIVGGYGVAGQQLVSTLKKCEIPYVISELNVENVRLALSRSETAFLGDITNAEVLVHLGADRARELVLVINDPNAVTRAVKAARSLYPDLYIVARSRYLLDVERLQKAGANEVIADEIESTVEVASRLLQRHPIPLDRADRYLNDIRDSLRNTPDAQSRFSKSNQPMESTDTHASE